MAVAAPYRLKGKKDIATLFSRGQSVRTKFFILRFLGNSLGHGRFAVVFPKTLKLSVPARNKLRRRMSAVFSENEWERLPFDMVVIVLPTILEKSYGEIKGVFEKAIFENLCQ